MKDCKSGFSLIDGFCILEISNVHTCSDGSICKLRTEQTCDSNNVCSTETNYSCSDGSTCTVERKLDTCPQGSFNVGANKERCIDAIEARHIKTLMYEISPDSNTFIFTSTKGTLFLDPENYKLKVSKWNLGSIYITNEEIELEKILKIVDMSGPGGSLKLSDDFILKIDKDNAYIEYKDETYKFDEEKKKGFWMSSKILLGIAFLIFALIIISVFKAKRE